MAQQTPGQTLQAIALVHEAYLRLTGGARDQWQDRAHFFRAAAEAMRCMAGPDANHVTQRDDEPTLRFRIKQGNGITGKHAVYTGRAVNPWR